MQANVIVCLWLLQFNNSMMYWKNRLWIDFYQSTAFVCKQMFLLPSTKRYYSWVWISVYKCQRYSLENMKHENMDLNVTINIIVLLFISKKELKNVSKFILLFQLIFLLFVTQLSISTVLFLPYYLFSCVWSVSNAKIETNLTFTAFSNGFGKNIHFSNSQRTKTARQNAFQFVFF